MINRLFPKKHSTQIMVAALYALTGCVLFLAFSQGSVVNEKFEGVRTFLFVLVTPLLIKLAVQIFAAFRYSYKTENQGYTLNNQPKVSVLLPAWNEEVGIVKTMLSVLQSDYSNFELVVINDGSTDKTDKYIRQFIGRYQPQSDKAIKYLSLENGGKARALNRALEIADGEIIITVDADCIVDPKAIRKIVQRFNDPQVGAVAGNIIVGNKEKPIELIQQLEYVCGFFFKRADSNFNAVHIIGGAAAAYRKSVLDNLKGFDEELITEDIEMSMRILGHGYKTRYANDAVIFTEGPCEFEGLSKQRLRWKYGRILSYLRHKELFMSNNRQHNRYLSWFILPLSIYAELILLLQGVFLTIFYGYIIFSQDYFSLAILILFSSSLVSLQIMTDSRNHYHKNLLLLAPVAWALLYVVDFVELKALGQSLRKLFKRESVHWQKWNRVGIDQNTSKPSAELQV